MLASAAATVETTPSMVIGDASPPPIERGRQRRNSSASCIAAMTPGVTLPSRSIRSASDAIGGAAARARATQSISRGFSGSGVANVEILPGFSRLRDPA